MDSLTITSPHERPDAVVPVRCLPSATPRARKRIVLAVIIAVLAGITMWAPSASAADNTLTGSNPANGAAVTASPASMVLNFANPLGNDNRVAVVCNGQPASTGGAQVGADRLSLTVPVPTALPKGTCVVTWLVSDAAGLPAGSGTFNFTVTTDAAPAAAAPAPAAPGDTLPVTGSTTAAPSTSVSANDAGTNGLGGGPLGVIRLVAIASLAILFGGFVLISLAWPEGVEYILTVRFLRTTFYVALAASVLFVIGLTSHLTGNGFGASVSPGQWKHLTDSGPGIAALFQLVFTAGCAWVVMRPERLIDPATQVPALAVPAIAVASLGFSRSLGDLAALGVVAGVAHALAMAIWFGGLVLLTRVVLAGPGESDLVHAVRGFSKISAYAIVVTVVSGIVQTYRLDGSGLFSTGHGYVTLLKIITVAAMIFVGLAARQFVHQRMRQADAMSPVMANRLRRAVGLEALAGVLVLVLSAWMLGLTPANAASTAAAKPDNTLGSPQLISNPDNGVEVRVAFSQVVGPNAVRVDVLQAPKDFKGLDVLFTPPEDSGVSAVTLNVPLNCTCSALLPQSDGLPLGAPGTWTITVSINGVEMGSKNVAVSAPTLSPATATTAVPPTAAPSTAAGSTAGG